MDSSKKIRQGQIEDYISGTTQTALDDRPRMAVNCNALGTPTNLAGGSGAVVYQRTFSADEFEDLDTLEVESINEKTGTAGTWVLRFYVDTASTFDIGTAQLLATSPSLTLGNLLGTLKREFTVRGTTLKGLLNTIGVINDENTNALAANAFTESTFDPSVSQTFYVVITGNVSDTVTKQNFKISVIKNKS
jgi:hypothetical protein